MEKKSNGVGKDQIFTINPSLGRPLFLNIDSKLKKTNFQAPILFASTIRDIKDFRESIRYGIELIPIFEYKWKLRELLVKAQEYEKNAGFWARIKRKLTKKKNKKNLFGRNR
ncbi:MAG: hypothetical protein ACFE8P_15150 [Promethearchaeota archaeon]